VLATRYGCRAPARLRRVSIRWPFAALAEVGIDISAYRSKSVDAIDPATIDTVITLCAEEVCPAFLGTAERMHWGLPDPAAVEGTVEQRLAAFRAVRDELQRHIGALAGDRGQGGATCSN